jgi:hypothetical protein
MDGGNIHPRRLTNATDRSIVDHTPCPVGLCAFLPLHAAGRHARGGHDNVLDRLMSSYTTTIRALHRHLARPGANVPGPAVAATALHRSVRALHLGLPTQ